MKFERVLGNLSAGSSKGAAQVMAQLARGQITQAMASELLGVIVATANAQGVAAAELVAGEWTDTLVTGIKRAPLDKSLLSRLDDKRLNEAINKIFGGDDETMLARVLRLAESEPVQAAQQAMGAAIRSNGAEGWRRGLNEGACQLCEWWERDGEIWPADHDMPTHNGCMCIQIPTTDKRS